MDAHFRGHDIFFLKLSQHQIAGELNTATLMVKSHVHNILEKLALNNRPQIANLSPNEETSKP